VAAQRSMQSSPLFGNGRFASLGAGLRAVALTGHARNAVAAASIAAVGSVAYVRSWKEPPPKAPSDRWVGRSASHSHACACTTSAVQCLTMQWRAVQCSTAKCGAVSKQHRAAPGRLSASKQMGSV
jgi:hypothetical protein